MPVQGDPFSFESNGKASRFGAGTRRKALLIGTSLLVYAASPSAAQAQQECGAPPPEGIVTCTPAGNPYPNGINYPGVVEDLTVVLEPGVQTQQGVDLSSSLDGIDLRLEGHTGTFINSSQNGPGAVPARARTAMRRAAGPVPTSRNFRQDSAAGFSLMGRVSPQATAERKGFWQARWDSGIRG